MKQHFKKLGHNVKKLGGRIPRLRDKRGTAQNGGPDSSSPPHGKQSGTKPDRGITEIDNGGFTIQSHNIGEQMMLTRQATKGPKKGNKVQIKSGGGASNWQALAKTLKADQVPLQPNKNNQSQYSKFGGAIDGQEQYKLQDLQSKEFVFCVSNEQLILTTIRLVMGVYNDDYNPTASTVAKGAPGGSGTPPSVPPARKTQAGGISGEKRSL